MKTVVRPLAQGVAAFLWLALPGGCSPPEAGSSPISADRLEARIEAGEAPLILDVRTGLEFEEGFRADIIVESLVVLELKSVEKITNSHRKQIQSYLKLSDRKLGYLLNFGEALMKDGIVRAVNHLG